MPLPNKAESKEEYVSRFMSDKTMKKKYPKKDQRLAIANSEWKKLKESVSVQENVKFSWTPSYKIKESSDGKTSWLHISGTALHEGVSKNGNNYTIENMKENDGKSFSWLVGHPKDASHPDYIVGEGNLAFVEGKLVHEGKIRNTKKYPDILEKAKDGLVVPSIHGSADKVIRESKDGKTTYSITGLRIPGVGLVNKNFQGVENASIDSAIAESFDAISKEKGDSMTIESKHGKKMKDDEAEEEMKKTLKKKKGKKQNEKQKNVSDEKDKGDKKMDEKLMKENETLKKQLAELKESAKKAIVSDIRKLNESKSEEELMKESEPTLKMILEYEKKLNESSDEEESSEESGEDNSGEAETGEASEEATEESDVMKNIVKEKNDFTMSKSLYESFNKELREQVR